MEIERIGNIIEGFFWIAISLIFWLPALRRRERQRGFCLTGGLVFFHLRPVRFLRIPRPGLVAPLVAAGMESRL